MRTDVDEVLFVAPDEGESLGVVGTTTTILADGARTGGAYALVEALMPVGDGPPPHLHRREAEAFYVIAGEVIVQAGGRVIRAAAGSCLHVPPGVVHTFRNEGPAAARLLVVISPAGFEGFFRRVGVPLAARHDAAPTPDAAHIRAVMENAAAFDMVLDAPGR